MERKSELFHGWAYVTVVELRRFGESDFGLQPCGCEGRLNAWPATR